MFHHNTLLFWLVYGSDFLHLPSLLVTTCKEFYIWTWYGCHLDKDAILIPCFTSDAHDIWLWAGFRLLEQLIFFTAESLIMLSMCFLMHFLLFYFFFCGVTAFDAKSLLTSKYYPTFSRRNYGDGVCAANSFSFFFFPSFSVCWFSSSLSWWDLRFFLNHYLVGIFLIVWQLNWWYCSVTFSLSWWGRTFDGTSHRVWHCSSRRQRYVSCCCIVEVCSIS